MAETKRDYPVIWIESGLHNFPEKLRSRLQEMLDEVTGYDRILMGFGFCGNAVAGLRTGNFEMILPRADDCIALLLGSGDIKKQYERTYFLTKGWLDGEKNIWWEYQYTINKYGPETGKEIFSIMLKNYKKLGVLDTGAYDIDAVRALTEEIAKELELEHMVLPATTDYLKSLLTGPWPEDRFLIIPPYHQIRTSQLTI
jgi:hypothetical protein